MKTKLLILLIGIAFLGCVSQNGLYKNVDIEVVLRDNSMHILFPVYIDGEKYELCLLGEDLNYYLKNQGVYEENIKDLIRDVYMGKKIFKGNDIGNKSYAIINNEYYNKHFKDADLQKVLKKYVKTDSFREFDKSISIKNTINSASIEGQSLTKYLILNNFLVAEGGYGHGLYIYDLNKGKTRIPLEEDK